MSAGFEITGSNRLPLTDLPMPSVRDRMSHWRGEHAVDTVEDQSVKCGKRDQPPCPTQPHCKGRLVPTEEGRCKRCGVGKGSRPCNTYPYCNGRLVSAIDGVQLESCENCGGEGMPPCLHEDTGRQRPGQSPCDKDLQRTSVSAGNTVMLVPGQGSYCTGAAVPGQCGYVGQASCSGDCYGRSTASEDGLQCIECGGPGQGTCDGVNQHSCDAGLIEFQEPSLAPICVCPVGGCNTAHDDCSEDGVLDQSGDGNTPDNTPDPNDPDASDECGGEGQPLCQFDEGPACASRLLPDEGGICYACGDEPGNVPCGEDDPPRCGFRLVLNTDFCESCGGEGEVVCCDKDQCTDDSDNRACDEGLFRTGSDIGNVVVKTVTAGAYCSTLTPTAVVNRCGEVDFPPCEPKEDDSGSEAELPCIGLSQPSEDGTKCEKCGDAGETGCADREKPCTGSLIPIVNPGSDRPFCFQLPEMADSPEVADQSSGDCGEPGMVACAGPKLCTGRSNVQALSGENGMYMGCALCGGADQAVCLSGEPCDGLLRRHQNRCWACGGLGEPVCPRPEMGAPCNTDLQPYGTICEPAGTVPPEEKEVEEKEVVIDQAYTDCGSDGAEPCPGQPACGDLLFLVEDAGALKCSSKQPGMYSGLWGSSWLLCAAACPGH